MTNEILIAIQENTEALKDIHLFLAIFLGLILGAILTTAITN